MGTSKPLLACQQGYGARFRFALEKSDRTACFDDDEAFGEAAGNGMVVQRKAAPTFIRSCARSFNDLSIEY